MKERFLTGLAIVFVVTVVFLTKIIMDITFIFDIFIGMLAILASIELANILKKSGTYSHSYLILIFPIVLYILMMICITSTLSFVTSLLLIVGLILVMALISFFISFFSRQKTESEMRLRKVYIPISRFSFFVPSGIL